MQRPQKIPWVLRHCPDSKRKVIVWVFSIAGLFIFIILVSVCLTGCSTYRNIQICPQACRPVVEVQGNSSADPTFAPWDAYYQRLHQQKIYYWLTDSQGWPVTSYRYKSEMSIDESLFSSYWPITPTKDKPKQIAEMVTLKRRTTNVVFNLIYPDGHVDSIPLHGAPLERHKDYEVLYVK